MTTKSQWLTATEVCFSLRPITDGLYLRTQADEAASNVGHSRGEGRA